MNSRHIHIDWYFKVLLLALLLGLGVEYAYGYDNTIHTINFQSRNNLFLGGSKEIKPATLRIREQQFDFTLPDIPQFTYNPDTGELETVDAEGNPQTIKIDVPENASYESVFPMLVTDSKGNTYQISPSEQNTEGTGNDGENGNKDEKIELTCERVERVGDFDTESLSSKYGYVRFERGEGKYAFDDGQEKWYRKSVKTDRFYKPFAKGYVASWKLVPSGEKDVVTARYDGLKDIDLSRVHFVCEPNSAALPARLNQAEQTWTITLKSASAGSTYDVFALYEGAVIGKLRVVSYAKQQHKVTLVPINEVKLDKAAIEQKLNAIYNPAGVQFTVDVDEKMRGNYDWEVASEKDGLLSTVGKSFWGYDKELKESTEMLNLHKHYQKQAGTLDGAYLFVLNGATGLEGQKGGLLGEMPRKSRFGYIFAGNSPNTEALAHTIAHELGHGIFTLQHTFDAEYGKGTQGTTNNLLDYTETGTELAAFQWNVMANPAVFTGSDKAEEGRFAAGIAISPDLKFISIPNTATVITSNAAKGWTGNLVVGTLPGFRLNDKDYLWNGEKYVRTDSADSAYTPTEVKYFENSTVRLFYNMHLSCGLGAYIEVPQKYSGRLKSILAKDNATAQRELFLLVYELAPQHSKPLPCVNGESDNAAKGEKQVPLDCNSAGNISDILKSSLDNISRITSSTEAAETNRILQENYFPCLFENIGIEKRICILNNLFKGDDSNWEFSNKFSLGDRFFLDELILSTPEADRVKLLQDGFMGKDKSYKWIEKIWEYSKNSLFNNDVKVKDIVPLISEISKWVMKHYAHLGIATTQIELKTRKFDNGQEKTITYSYPLGAQETLLGVTDGLKGYQSSSGLRYNVSLPTYTNKALGFDIKDGKALFNVRYYIEEADQVYAPGSGPSGRVVSEQRSFEPFELMDMTVVGNFATLGYNANDKFTVPAIMGVVLANAFEEEQKAQRHRDILNGVVIAGGIISAPYTGGGSLTALSADLSVISALVAAADMVQNEHVDNFSVEELAANKETLQAWEKFKAIVYTADAIGGGATLAQSITRGLAKVQSWDELLTTFSKNKNYLRGNAGTIYNKVVKGEKAVDEIGIALKNGGWSDDLIKEFESTFKGTKTLENTQSWKLLKDANRTGLMKNADAVEALTKVRANKNLKNLGATDELLAKIEGAEGVSYEQVLNNLDLFANNMAKNNVALNDFNKVLNQLAQTVNKRDGANWIVEYLGKNAHQFKGKAIKFEEFYDTALGGRYIDVTSETANEAKIFYEFKSVKNVPPTKFAEQFMKDLDNANSLDQIKWIFNGSKNPPDFKKNMLEAIDKLPLTDDLAKKFLKGDEIIKSRDLKKYLKDNFEMIFKKVD